MTNKRECLLLLAFGTHIEKLTWLHCDCVTHMKKSCCVHFEICWERQKNILYPLLSVVVGWLLGDGSFPHSLIVSNSQFSLRIQVRLWDILHCDKNSKYLFHYQKKLGEKYFPHIPFGLGWVKWTNLKKVAITGIHKMYELLMWEKRKESLINFNVYLVW